MAAADARRLPVDHVTARRLAIWLAARPQPSPFARALVTFTRTGAITRDLHNHLRAHARSAAHAHRPQAAWLLDYTIARGTDRGPIGTDFGAACDQLDRADLMLTELHQRNHHGIKPSEPAWPDTPAPAITALARRNPESQTVTFVLDADTAKIAIYAIAVHAQEREAHLREVQLHAQNLPEGSYGRRNRQAITDRETRVTTRLRAIEQAYQTAIEHGTAPRTPEPVERFRPPDRAAGQEIDLEAGS